MLRAKCFNAWIRVCINYPSNDLVASFHEAPRCCSTREREDARAKRGDVSLPAGRERLVEERRPRETKEEVGRLAAVTLIGVSQGKGLPRY